MQVDPTETNMSVFITAAFRYALGRQTYAVGCVCEILESIVNEMPLKDRELIVKEIDRAISQGNAGARIDVSCWKRIKRAMKKKEGEK